MRRLVVVAIVAAQEAPVTLTYRGGSAREEARHRPETLVRKKGGAPLNGDGRYAWLEPEEWAAYTQRLYGSENATTIQKVDVVDRSLLPPALMNEHGPPRGCPASDDEPFKRFNWHAPFSKLRYFRRRTARDSPPPAFRNHTKVEVSHCGGSRFEKAGAFFYAFRGTGLYVDVGRTLAFESHDDAARYLLARPCAPGKPADAQLGIFQCDAELPAIIAAAKDNGWDSLQFTRHCDAFCTGPSPEALARARTAGKDPWTMASMSDALSGANPRAQLCGFEVVLTRFGGADACPAGVQFFRGWGGGERCACDDKLGPRSQRGRCAACAPFKT